MSKSPYRRASQSRPLLGKSDCFIQSPCSRHKIFIRVSVRLQATAAPDAPEPMITTSTFSLRPLPGFALLEMVIQIPPDVVIAQPTLALESVFRSAPRQVIRPDGDLCLSVDIRVYLCFCF